MSPRFIPAVLIVNAGLIQVVLNTSSTKSPKSLQQHSSSPTVPPRNHSREFAVESSLQEKVLTRCLKATHAIPPSKIKSHLYSFKTSGVAQCWFYCKATFRCTILYFEILNSTCSLFSEESLMPAKGNDEGLLIKLKNRITSKVCR